MSKFEYRPRPPHRRLGILAGGGQLPREIAESAAARGLAVHIVAIDSEADDRFTGFSHTLAGWGQIGRMIGAFRKAGITDLVIVGRVSRPDLKRLRPDLGFLLGLPEIIRLVAGGGGDDGVLRGVIRFFERRGFRVVGPAAVAPEVLIATGALGTLAPSDAENADIALGFEVIADLGRFDIGQGVVVSAGRLLAVEAAENTDAMLQRVGRLRREGRRRGETQSGFAQSGVLVKRPKPGQDLRIDLPAVGPRTVIEAAEAGLSGIAVMANAVVAAERAEMQVRIDAAKMFLVGVDAEIEPGQRRAAGRAEATVIAAQCQTLAGVAGSEAQARDIAAARGVIGVLRRFEAGRAVVASRGHILAVEAGEGAAAAIRRAGALRQWGAARSKRRSAVAVLASAIELTPDVLAAADEARLAGIAILTQPGELKADGTRIAAEAVARSGRTLSIWAAAAEKETA